MRNGNNRTFLPLSKKGLAVFLGMTLTALPVSNAFAVTPSAAQNSNIIVSDDFAWAKSALSENESTLSIDMEQHFSPLDANTMTLTAVSSQEGVLTTAVSGKSLVLSVKGYGTSTIEVKAADQTGLTLTETFQITINKIGDIDGDGIVTSSDALFVSKVVKGLITVSPEEKKKYDINKDGSVTNADVTALMTLIASQKNGSSTPPLSDNNYMISIRNTNDAPLGLPTHVTVNEDTELKSESSLVTNAIDIDNDSLSVLADTQPAHGTLSLKNDGTFTYKPDINFNGIDTFTYKVTDGSIESAPITVSIEVLPINDDPVAQDQAIQATEDTPVNGLLTGEDIDSSSLTYQLVTNGTKGNVVITDSSTGAFTYTPDHNANGTDSFTFKISDGTGESNTATITVSITAVNDAPSAASDLYDIEEDQTLTVPKVSGVLSNDTDIENDSLTAILVSGTAHGSLTLNSDGSFQYKPDDNYFGTDTFTYKANDGGSDSNPVTVTLNVTPVNDLPWAQDGTLSVSEDTPKNGQLTGGDIDSTSLTYQIVSNGSKGTVTITNAATGEFTYTPNSNENGTDSFTYKVNDGISDSTAATVTVHIDAVNDAPFAGLDEFTTAEDQTLTVTGTSGVLSNDTDVENDSLTAVLVSGTAHGSLTLNSDGSFQYKPDDNYFGTDSFTYKANDGTSDSNPVTVTLNVTPVNDLPWVQDGTLNVSEDTPKNGQLIGGDIDSTSLTYQIVSNGSKGTVTITNAATGEFTYTPNSNANGTDSFTYKMNDGISDSTTATVTVNIDAVNDAPFAGSDEFTTAEDQTLTVTGTSGVLSNDTDIENDSLTAILVSGTAHGSLTLNSDGSFQYKPDDNYYGTDSFTYKANDGASDSNPVTVTINVTPVNDLPWVQDGTLSVSEDTPKNGQLIGGDIDSTSLTYQIVSNGTKGNVVITNPSNGAFIYTPYNNLNGTDSFTFKISDGSGDSTTATVNVVIDAVNDTPIISNAVTDQSMVTGTADITLDLANVFADIDGDLLTYSAVSSDTSIATVSVSGTNLSLSSVAAGTAVVTITANDGNGGLESVSFKVKVTNPNSAPVVNQTIPGMNITAGSGISTVDLAAIFSDADQDTLTFIAESSDPSIATVSVAGSSLEVTPVSAGSTSITVTAMDGNGGTASTIFTVTVEAGINVTLTPVLFDRDQLTEANLKAATILLTLDGDSFKDTATELDFQLNNAPAGLTLGPALVMGNEAYLILDYDGPDFDADIYNFSITALGSATESGNPIQSADMTITAIQEPNGPVFISEYLQSDNGRVAIEIFNKGVTPELGYTLEVYQYNSLINKKSSYTIDLITGPTGLNPNMTYNIINSSFYDFFDIMNVWYFNSEAVLSGNGLVNTAFVLKKNGVVVDAIGDPAGSAAILPTNGTMVRKQNFAGGMTSYQEYQWSFFPNGTFQYFGNHTP